VSDETRSDPAGPLDEWRVTELRPGPARSSESSDWRFAVLVLMTLLIAVLVFSGVVYVKDGSIPAGFGNLVSALTGALVVTIGKRML
jgi:hypothetical protein